MRVLYTAAACNRRRYSKAWVARVVEWRIGKSPELMFGGTIDYDTAEIEAEPGDIIRYGRKDLRGNGSINEWGIVQTDGSIEHVVPMTARDRWIQNMEMRMARATCDRGE